MLRLRFAFTWAMRVVGSVGVGLLLVALGCHTDAAKATMPPATGEGAAPMPVLPALEAPNPSDLRGTNRTTGTTFAHQEAQLGPNVTGVISKILVREADVVKKGDVVFRQDRRDAELRVAQADAAVRAAEVSLRATEVEHLRMKALSDQNAIGQAQSDQMLARLEGAQIQAEQAKVGLQMAVKFLEDTQVRAPFDGVVIQKFKNEGELATTMPPTVVLVLQDQATLDLRFRLPEGALLTVRPGMVVKARFSAVNLSREAKIARIVPIVDPRTRTFEIVAELANADGALKPGLLAEVTLDGDAR